MKMNLIRKLQAAGFAELWRDPLNGQLYTREHAANVMHSRQNQKPVESSASPDGNWSVKELIETAEKLLEWMPICSTGISGDIRQRNLRAAIDKFKARTDDLLSKLHGDSASPQPSNLVMPTNTLKCPCGMPLVMISGHAHCSMNPYAESSSNWNTARDRGATTRLSPAFEAQMKAESQLRSIDAEGKTREEK